MNEFHAKIFKDEFYIKHIESVNMYSLIINCYFIFTLILKLIIFLKKKKIEKN